MRKSTKLVVLVAALVALCSIAALAADTWKQDGDNWYCYDSEGNMVYGEAKKSGNSWYYLDDATGVMVKEKLIETTEGKYYYGADGARVIGNWAKVAVETDVDANGFKYMYFEAVTGKAVGYATTAGKQKTINGKKYFFDTDGYMVYGYRSEDRLSSADYASTAYYNYGKADEGWAQEGWVKVENGDDDNYSTKALVYFYFDSNGKKYANVTDKKINGKKYNFDEKGAMISGWAVGTNADFLASQSASAKYYGAADDGVLKKSQWIKTTKFTDEDTPKWYYLKSDGSIQAAGIAKINGKRYLFNASRQMVSGVAKVNVTDKTDYAKVSYVGGFDTMDEFKAYGDAAGFDFTNKGIMFFSNDADTDGSLKVGTQTISIDGEEATIVLDKRGFAYEGYNTSTKKIYKNGIVQTAGDSRVAVKKLRVAYESYPVGYYAVNASGAILKNTKTTDSDGIYWVIKTPGAATTFKFADTDYASNCATAVKNAAEGTRPATFTVKIDGADKVYNIHYEDVPVSTTDATVQYTKVWWN